MPFFETADPHCRQCGKKLSFFKRLFQAEFCRDSHRSAYLRSLNELALARLYDAERKPATPGRAGSTAA